MAVDGARPRPAESAEPTESGARCRADPPRAESAGARHEQCSSAHTSPPLPLATSMCGGAGTSFSRTQDVLPFFSLLSPPLPHEELLAWSRSRALPSASSAPATTATRSHSCHSPRSRACGRSSPHCCL
ncbi:unnamed protein product [Urochloa humidicola]